MIRSRSRLLLGATAWLFSAGLAGGAAAQDLQTLRGADTDGDHAISIAEATAVLQQEYGRLDANHDGTVTQDEFVNARLAQLAKLDTDGDGKITREEVRGFVRTLRPNTP
jgi:Ca2+-binding EF-hand superfamily protein